MDEALEAKVLGLLELVRQLTERVTQVEESLDYKASQSHCEGLQSNIDRLAHVLSDVERKLSDKADHYDLRQMEQNLERKVQRGW